MKKITNELGPESVLALGPGSGWLVEQLRHRGIAAMGVEPDPDRIAQADPAVRPFLVQGDYAGPLPEGPFSLIISLDAPGHLPSERASEVIASLCRRADQVIFSAEPGAEDPDSGLPARSPGSWAGLFAEHGFFSDLAYDASYISPRASRYRRRPALSKVELAEMYEDEIWRLRRQNEQNGPLEEQALVKMLVARVQQWESVWADLERSTGWRLLRAVRVLRMRIAPPGSRRAALLDMVRDSLAGLRAGGPAEFFRIIRRDLKSDALRVARRAKSIEQINAENYADLVRRSAPDPQALAQARIEAGGWDDRPLISFITPVYNPAPEVLRATLDSVRNQAYDHWEMCIADASPNAPEIRDLLARCSAEDDRIRVKTLPQNLGIAGNSNAAIEMAAGEFIAILDHDDVIPPDMLYEVVRRIRENPEADLVYFDEDKLSEDGLERRAPFFKPDFSPELLISVNYLTHAVYRRSLVNEIGGFDMAFDGCQDWDLAFKVTERTRQIEHIPRVLYHWRQVSGSTAGDFGAKSYVFERQLRCVQEHLRRTGIGQAHTAFRSPGLLQATWPASGAKVSIIIPTRDNVAYLKRAIQSIETDTRYPDLEIIIVDNGSLEKRTHRYFEQLKQRESIRFVDFSEMFNYSRANNRGAAAATGEILLFLNNDIEALHEDWLEEMVRWVERPEIGVVGAKLLYPDNTVQHAGVIVGLEGHASHVFWGYRDRQTGPFGSADWYRNFSAVTGACMMIRKDTFQALGGFDERYILAFSDVEICLRAIDHGLRVLYTPHARLRHYEGKSRGNHIPSNDILAGIEDFYRIVEGGDPYYNPNLSYKERQPTIRPAAEADRIERLHQASTLAQINNLVR